MDNFLTKSKFSKLVERTVISYNMSHIDAVVHLCEENDIDLETCKKFIDTTLRSKIEAEAMSLNLLPKTNTLF